MPRLPVSSMRWSGRFREEFVGLGRAQLVPLATILPSERAIAFSSNRRALTVRFLVCQVFFRDFLARIYLVFRK